MGVQPVPSLLIKMSLPMMASMLVMALYNIVDSVFVSRISENALTAVSLVYPFQMLFISVAVGTGVGVNSLIARRLGERRQADADRAAATGQFLGARERRRLYASVCNFPGISARLFCGQCGDPRPRDSLPAHLRRALRLRVILHHGRKRPSRPRATPSARG